MTSSHRICSFLEKMIIGYYPETNSTPLNEYFDISGHEIIEEYECFFYSNHESNDSHGYYFTDAHEHANRHAVQRFMMFFLSKKLC